ncbi:hypothetical protein EDI_110200 [Entamoeba dispar SAW760]|uniref:Uncharacterized protein n=1 Tax=Entamoeba dispar (strain ATCC PRA-260 / SAW760) TaxID=370354 RepID=B0EK30_ENTDS|nr:uncharacterized protein EDI_110200 [Entamoeba dispar SAW760]EDR25098.1 hypothetical protein EDI_110200 [Entamoeba dispar SAW760]|eukprot:EDR25098.1 hypothetical protein EDI_110200 [Entamoeba dispar SAW760]
MYLTTSLFESIKNPLELKSVDYDSLPLPVQLSPCKTLLIDSCINSSEIQNHFPLFQIRDIFILPIQEYSTIYGSPISEVPFIETTKSLYKNCNYIFERKECFNYLFAQMREGIQWVIQNKDISILQIIYDTLIYFLHQIQHQLFSIKNYFNTNIMSTNELIIYRIVIQLLQLYIEQIKIYLYECQTFLTTQNITYPITVYLVESLVPTTIMKGKEIQIKVFLLSGTSIHLPTLQIDYPNIIITSLNNCLPINEYFDYEKNKFEPYPFCGGCVLCSTFNCTTLKGTNKEKIELRISVSINLPKEDGNFITTTFLSTNKRKMIIITNNSQWFISQSSLLNDAIFSNSILCSVPIDRLFNYFNSIALLSLESQSRQKLPSFDYEQAYYITDKYLPSIGCPRGGYINEERCLFCIDLLLKYYEILTKSRTLYVLYSQGCLFRFIEKNDLSDLLILAQTKLPFNCLVVALVFDVEMNSKITLHYIFESIHYVSRIHHFRKTELAKELNDISMKTNNDIVLLQSTQPFPPFTESTCLNFINMEDLLNGYSFVE